jgi:serine/threonine protein kinase/tetratricopeptide (TPR) repeat protein
MMSQVDHAASENEPGFQMVCPSCNATYSADAVVCESDGTGLLEVPKTPLLTGGSLDDRYDVRGVVGSGGMGVVYRAYQRAMEREVAIKVLHPQYAHEPRAVKRFFREAQSASRLIHPNIVTVYDFGRSREGHLYMVMELLEGWTLGDLIYHRAPLNPSTVVHLGVQICSALAAAHNRRIVHRDLKPDNVQLVSRDGSIWSKVLDFGIARLMRDESSSLGMHLSTVDIAGTPAYMSPEQIMGKDPDPRSDLYSLGIILYEALTGERPFDDDNSVALCMKQLNDTPPPLSSFLAPEDLPEDLEAIVSQLMSKDLKQRPAGAAEVKALLERSKLYKGTSRLSEQPKVSKVSLGSLPTRPDADVISALAESNPDRRAQVLATASKRLGDVIQGVRSEPPGNTQTPRGRHRTRSGRLSSCGFIVLMASRQEEFKHESVEPWLTARTQEGWDVTRRGNSITLRVPRLKQPADTFGKELIALTTELRDTLRRGGVLIRAGIVAPSDDALGPLALIDLARRLAVAVPYGELAMPTDLAKRLAIRVRPITAVSLPSGAEISGSAIGPNVADVTEQAPFYGRTRELRLLGNLAEQARSDGAQAVWVNGPRGVGRTALLRTFCHERRHLYVRVSPAAKAWPGYSAGRLVRLALGVPDTAQDADVRSCLETLPVHLRDRLALLLLDERPTDALGAQSCGHAVTEVLSRYAGDEHTTFVLDDAHLMDEASRYLLEDTIDAASEQPWLFIASTPADADVPFDGATKVELRPLGGRAMGALADLMEVPADSRSRLVSQAVGNPLALRLLASVPAELRPNRASRVLSTLLPQLLRDASPHQAKAAWFTALFGQPETANDVLVRAARLYLEVGLGDELRQWLGGCLKSFDGMRGRLRWAFVDEGFEGVKRVKRVEALGLWALAAHAAERCAERIQHVDDSRALRIDGARLRALAGDVGGAVERFEETVGDGVNHVKSDAGALVRFGSVLLDLGERDRAEHVLERARKVLRHDEQPGLYAQLAALLSRCAIRRNASDEAMVLLGRSREVVRPLRQLDARLARSIEALIQEVRAEIALADGDAEATRTNLRQARDGFRDLGRSADAIRCLNELGRVELDDEQPGNAADIFRAATRLANTLGLATEARRARAGLGEALVGSGDTEEGTAILRRVMREAGGRCRDRTALASAAVGLSRAMVSRELPEDATRYAELALADAVDPTVAVRAHLALAEAQMMAGNARHAVRTFQKAADAACAAGHGLLRSRADTRLVDLELIHGVSVEAAGAVASASL